VVVWLAFEETRISRKAKAAMDEARQGVRGLAISDFLLYEHLKKDAQCREWIASRFALFGGPLSGEENGSKKGPAQDHAEQLASASGVGPVMAGDTSSPAPLGLCR
jgi:hypothetical protein